MKNKILLIFTYFLATVGLFALFYEVLIFAIAIAFVSSHWCLIKQRNFPYRKQMIVPLVLSYIGIGLLIIALYPSHLSERSKAWIYLNSGLLKNIYKTYLIYSQENNGMYPENKKQLFSKENINMDDYKNITFFAGTYKEKMSPYDFLACVFIISPYEKIMQTISHDGKVRLWEIKEYKGEISEQQLSNKNLIPQAKQ